MTKFIIVSVEGYTQDPSGKEVDNMQVLAEIEADSGAEALEQLKKIPSAAGFGKKRPLKVYAVCDIRE